MSSSRPTIITVGIQKGGTGKTSLAIGLAGAWVRQGLRIGIADFDPQCNATRSLLPDDISLSATIHDCLWDQAFLMEDVGVPAKASEQIIVYPGSPDALLWELVLMQRGREHLLRKAPEILSARLPTNVDVLLIDTPPTLGAALQMALTISDFVFIPTTPERKALMGFTQLVETIDWVRARTNPDLRVAGIVVNRVRGTGTTLQKQWGAALRERFGEHVLAPAIPERTAIDEQSTTLVPVTLVDRADDDTATMVRHLADQLAERCGIVYRQPEPAELSR